MMDQQHKVFVITGAAGTGKTTVANYLRKIRYGQGNYAYDTLAASQ